MTQPHYCLARKATRALFVACTSAIPLSRACLELLLLKGANINALDTEGYTPLMRATLLNEADKVSILVACGADLDVMGPNGQQALHMAHSNGYAEIARLLTHAHNISPEARARKLSPKSYGLG